MRRTMNTGHLTAGSGEWALTPLAALYLAAILGAALWAALLEMIGIY